jgi:hypothetical protein
LNPKKCVFRVKRGKFLGCLVSTKVIKANSLKIKAILEWSHKVKKMGLDSRKTCFSEQVCFEIYRTKFAVLRSLEIRKIILVGTFSAASI